MALPPGHFVLHSLGMTIRMLGQIRVLPSKWNAYSPKVDEGTQCCPVSYFGFVTSLKEKKIQMIHGE